MEIYVKTVIQAGDVFLLKFRCPQCNMPQLIGYSEMQNICDACKCPFHELPFNFPEHRKDFRLLSGTKRKHYINKRMVRALMELQGDQCAYCVKPIGIRFHIEHVIPLTAGGSNRFHNLVLSCPECNFIAGSKVFTHFMMKQKYILERRKILRY